MGDSASRDSQNSENTMGERRSVDNNLVVGDLRISKSLEIRGPIQEHIGHVCEKFRTSRRCLIAHRRRGNVVPIRNSELEAISRNLYAPPNRE